MRREIIINQNENNEWVWTFMDTTRPIVNNSVVMKNDVIVIDPDAQRISIVAISMANTNKDAERVKTFPIGKGGIAIFENSTVDWDTDWVPF